MSVNILDEGKFELLKTNHNHKILHLNEDEWYAWIRGRKGEILVKTDSHHKIEKKVEEGKFVVADFNNEPDYRDMPHLFLEEGKSYRELMLPNGLTTQERDYQKLIVETDNHLSEEEVDKLKRRGH